MELKQNPFSLYDFLGYLIPGSIFVLGLYVIANHLGSPNVSLVTHIKTMNQLVEDAYIPALLISYVCGHFISYLSSITIEKYATWTLGYPSKYLLGMPFPKYFTNTNKSCSTNLIRLFVAFILFPISLIDFFVISIFGKSFYAKNVGGNLELIFNKKVIDLIKNVGNIQSPTHNSSANEENYFLLAYHYAVENSDNHLPKLQNYVALFGFSRTLTFLFLSLFWFIFIYAISFNQLNQHTYLLMTSLSITTYIFYLNFIKFYRRFSLEALMALSVTK